MRRPCTPHPGARPRAHPALAALVLFSLGTLSASAAESLSVAQGAVAAPDRYSADAAASILAAGGNAVDAAVAMAFMLAVTYPEAGNLGGGGFATVYFAGQSYFLDYRERAPAAATAGMFLDAQGNVVPDASTVGALAVGVPGTVLGMWELHHRFGSLPWRRLLAPAIVRARTGFSVPAELASRAREYLPTLGPHTNFARYFSICATEGAILRQPELAATLTRIAQAGADEFYHGHTADLIASEMQHDHGIVTRADLGDYRVVWREPLVADWAGYRVVTAPPPSSGGIGLIALLRMKADVSSLFAGVALNSAQYVHLLAELEKRVFADRAEHLGDPDFTPVPVASLLDEQYLASRARGIDPEHPTPTERVTAGTPDHHDTTHFSIVDAGGNAVSNTFTLNDDFGSGVVVSGAGFLLNNEMDDFSAKPGVANIYGVVGGEANAIAPGKHPLSSMTPTILLRDNRVALVIGTPGGSRIFTSVFQVITDWHDFHMPLAAAVSAVRVHHQLLPPNVIYEEGWRQLDPATVRELESRGYRVENQGWSGDIAAVEVTDSRMHPVADPRGRGEVRVVRNPPRQKMHADR
jgi:gamma-glutamyltranspeptidase / glutathione hydrolase